jgi:hypothetical protein
MLDHGCSLADAPLSDNDGKAVGKSMVTKKVSFEFAIANAQKGLAESNEVA